MRAKATQFIQCDDLVEPAVADEIERTFVGRGFPWHFQPNVNSVVRPEDRAAHDTVIFDKTYPDRDNAAVLQSVSPKKGRMILFDGRHYHCGTAPARHDVRVVINYDFV